MRCSNGFAWPAGNGVTLASSDASNKTMEEGIRARVALATSIEFRFRTPVMQTFIVLKAMSRLKENTAKKHNEDSDKGKGDKPCISQKLR